MLFVHKSPGSYRRAASWRRNVVFKTKCAGERCCTQGCYKQQLFLIMEIDSFPLPGCYLNKWEEQNTVPWSLSVALYPCKFKAEDRTNPSFCFPAVFSLKHAADEGPVGEDSLAPSLPHPAVKARLVGRKGLHRLRGPSVFNLLSGG